MYCRKSGPSGFTNRKAFAKKATADLKPSKSSSMYEDAEHVDQILAFRPEPVHQLVADDGVFDDATVQQLQVLVFDKPARKRVIPGMVQSILVDVDELQVHDLRTNVFRDGIQHRNRGATRGARPAGDVPVASDAATGKV
jgi:hypothetical protein